VRLLVRPGAGISAGRNAGVRAAGNEVVACTDAGCEPAPGWLAAFRAAAADGAPAGLLTGVYRVRARGPVQVAQAAVGYPDPTELRWPSLLVRTYGRLFGRTYDPTMPTGRSMAFPVPVWAAAGGFPEHLRTGEDVLFGRAVAAAGRPTVLVADAEVTWTQRPTLAGTARMYFRYGQASGRSRDPRLLGRDLARLAGYAVAPWLLARRGAARAGGLAAGAAYLSLPVVRVLRGSATAGEPARGQPAEGGPAGGGSVRGCPAGREPVRGQPSGGQPAGGGPAWGKPSVGRPAGSRAGGGWMTRALAVAALPPAAALRDLAKAAGALHGLAARRRR
jgi:hypothetical protein